MLAPVDDIHGLMMQTKVALVPSLWAEARSRVILEAMVRGIPVMASQVGGLSEAKLGVDYLLPVNPVVRYRATVDHLMVPSAEIPPQDVAPWLAALERLVTDRAHYEEISKRSAEAARAYADGLSAAAFESYLEKVLRSGRHRHRAAPAHHPKHSALPEKQRLLASRLRRRPRASNHKGE